MNANEPAYPFLDVCEDVEQVHTGLTKRELIAAMAMQGLLACPETTGTFSAIAKDVVCYADALLAELAKETT